MTTRGNASTILNAYQLRLNMASPTHNSIESSDWSAFGAPNGPPPDKPSSQGGGHRRSPALVISGSTENPFLSSDVQRRFGGIALRAVPAPPPPPPAPLAAVFPPLVDGAGTWRAGRNVVGFLVVGIFFALIGVNAAGVAGRLSAMTLGTVNTALAGSAVPLLLALYVTNGKMHGRRISSCEILGILVLAILATLPWTLSKLPQLSSRGVVGQASVQEMGWSGLAIPMIVGGFAIGHTLWNHEKVRNTALAITYLALVCLNAAGVAGHFSPRTLGIINLSCALGGLVLAGRAVHQDASTEDPVSIMVGLVLLSLTWLVPGALGISGDITSVQVIGWSGLAVPMLVGTVSCYRLSKC